MSSVRAGALGLDADEAFRRLGVPTREAPLLGRALRNDEAREVQASARRITAILLLEPALDANYTAVTDATYAWPGR